MGRGIFYDSSKWNSWDYENFVQPVSVHGPFGPPALAAAAARVAGVAAEARQTRKRGRVLR
jgi:hypothetical protein